jgi:replicative DNA helicase
MNIYNYENKIISEILNGNPVSIDRQKLTLDTQNFISKHEGQSVENYADDQYVKRYQEVLVDISFDVLPVDYCIEKINRNYEKRQLQSILLESNKDNFSIYDASKKIDDILKNNVTEKFNPVLVNKVFDEIKNRKLDDYKLPERFGLPHTYLYRKNVNLIGAYSGVGKTYFILNLILDMVLSKQPVLFFSLEMTTDTLIRRLLQLYAYAKDKLTLNWLDTVDSQKINPYIKSESEFSKSVESYLTIIDRSFLTSGEICNLSKQYIYKKHIKPIVFLDYVQIVSSEISERRNAIINIMTEFVSFSKDNDIIFVLLSQTNRTSKENPTITSFSESSILEQASGLAMTLFRYDNQIEFPVMQFNIVKNRFGRLQSCWVNWIKENGYVNGLLNDSDKFFYGISEDNPVKEESSKKKFAVGKK